MRAPSFKGLRYDKPAAEVVARGARAATAGRAGGAPQPAPAAEALFDEVERAARGRAAVIDRRPPLKLSNWDKVLFPRDRLHQGRPDRLLRAGRAGACCPTCTIGR